MIQPTKYNFKIITKFGITLSMEINILPIAPKQEVQKFRSKIKLFFNKSKSQLISKDIFVPVHFTLPINSISKDQDGKDSPIMKIKSIQSLISFFNQISIPESYEIPLNSIKDLISLVLSSDLTLKLCLATYIRSLSLIINYLLIKNVSNYDQSNKIFIQKAYDTILSLPIQSSFYPEVNQHPLIDFDFLNYKISSPTSICVSNDFIFTCSENGKVTKYQKSRITSVTSDIYSIPADFGVCSIIFLKEKIFFVNLLQKCIIIDTKRNFTSDVFSTVLSYPSISDGRYIYAVIFDKKIKINIFYESIEKVEKTIELKVPETVKLTNLMPMSTNGTFINFIDNEKCHIFSILTGRYITTKKVSLSLYSIVYDFTYNGFVFLSENGLVEVPSKSTVSPWQLNFDTLKLVDGYDEKIDLESNFLNAIGLVSIHFVGGDKDFPLSTLDDGCLDEIECLTSHLMNKVGEVNTNGLLTSIGILQVKMRRFSKLPSNIDQILIQIFSDDRFTFARRCAAFLFLSCLSLFEKKWNQNCTKLLHLIVDDRNCSDIVISFLRLFTFNSHFLNEDLINSILTLMVNSSDNDQSRAVCILSSLQERLISELPESKTLFTSYVSNLMTKLTETYNMYLSSGDDHFLTSTCFNAVKFLVMQIMKNNDKISLPLSVTERFFSVSMLKPIGNDDNEIITRTKDIFKILLFYALHFVFKKIESTDFVVCSQKVERNHTQISMNDFKEIESTNTKVVEILVKCTNESNWNDISEVIHFLNDLKEKFDNIEELTEKVGKVHSIQPQPLRKIHHYLTTGEFSIVKHEESAIFQLMNYEQWIPSSFNRLLFSTFLAKIELYQDDFLCVPRSYLKPFVQGCPVTVLLPHSLIVFAKVKLNEIPIDFHQFRYTYDKISDCTNAEQCKDFVKLFMNFKTNLAPNKQTVSKALIAAIIGFRKSNIKSLNDEIIEKLVYCRKAVYSVKMVKLLVEVVKIFSYKNDHRAYNFIIEIVGSCILKKSGIFLKAKNTRSMFQFAYEFVEFSRELLLKSNDFREFLSSSDVLGNDDEESSADSHSTLNENDIHVIKKLAFLTIVNNVLSFPIVGSEFTAVDRQMVKIRSKISKISKNGHNITLESGVTYDIRNLFEYDVTSPHHIDAEIFSTSQADRIVDFFNIFHKYFKLSTHSIEKSINDSELALNLRPLISILYFTSLQCLSFNHHFVTKFNGIYSLSAMTSSYSHHSGDVIKGDERIILEPINEKAVFRRFWEFYSQPSTLDFSIFESNGGYSTSPISPNTHFSVRFHFTGMCESVLYCCFPNSSSMSEMRDTKSDDHESVESFVFQELNDQALVYQTVTFSDYFDFVLDADSQQASMTNQYDNQTVTFPIYNSALFYSIFIKAKDLTFEVKNKQWPLDKMTSFESYDFSLFKLCRFNHVLTIPCKSFEDSFLNELGIIIRNRCMKTIVKNMVKVKPIDSSLCVSFVTTMLSNFEELFKNSHKKLRTRIKGNIELNSNFDIPLMTQIFIMYVRNSLKNVSSYFIWRNNEYAKPAKKGTIVCNCVIFAPGIIKMADKKTEVEFDCFILPKEHLNRTAIELLMFSKNALIFCKETKNEEAFNEVVSIMKLCEKNKIPGFTETDLKSVDTVINEVNELFESEK